MASTTSITLNFDSSIITPAVTALCALGGYQATVDDGTGTGNTIPNPVTPAAFAKQQLIKYVYNQMTEYQNRQALAGVTSPNSNLIS
jgi:hypothetical protein